MGLNEVFKKVSAINEVTELASEKIELANILDFGKLSADADMKLKKFNEYMSQLDKLIQPVIKSGELYLKALDDAMDMNNEIALKFKEIGLDWTITPEAKNFKNIRTRGDRQVVQTMVARVKNI